MWLAEAKSRDAWGHTAAVMALLANCHRDPRKRKRAFRPGDFDPYAREARKEPVIHKPKDEVFRLLKAAFVRDEKTAPRVG